MTHSPRDKGTVLLMTLMVVATLTSLSLCALLYTSSVAKNVERSNNYRRCLDLGDGAIDYGFAFWRETCRMKSNITRPGADFANIPLPTATMFNRVTNFQAQRTPNASTTALVTLANYNLVAVDPQYLPVDQSVAPPMGIGMSIGTRSTYYKMSADVSLPTRGNPMLVKMRRIFEKQIVAPWNYAIFYIDDLELHPGPDFVVTGPVHSNGKVYTGHASLTFASKLTYGDDWSIGFKPGDGSHPETPTTPHWPSNQPPTREQGQQPYGLDSTRIFSTTDTSANNDSYREIVEQKSGTGTDPFTDLTDPSNPRQARYYDQADIKILFSSTGTMTVRDGSDTLLTSTSTGNAKKIYDLVNSAVITGTSIQDNREAAQVKLTNLDISKFYAAFKTGGTMATVPFDGVIYISDARAASAPANERRAIRLINGAFVPQGGLTIASDNAIYIQGDYNTGASGTSIPPSNKTGSANDPTQPTVAGYNREPCAVIADAVMILSNNWKDSLSTSDVSLRLATNTTINTAIISGIVPSGISNNNYSGGAENFPRLLETWGSDNTFTYYGSMIELYKSKYHTGVWGKNNVYDPPERNWYFDTKFYVNPPPGTLDIVLYKKGRWFIE